MAEQLVIATFVHQYVRRRMERRQRVVPVLAGEPKRYCLGQRAGNDEMASLKAQQLGYLVFEALKQFALAIDVVADVMCLAPGGHLGKVLSGRAWRGC